MRHGGVDGGGGHGIGGGPEGGGSGGVHRGVGLDDDEHVAPGLAQHLDAHRPEEPAQKGVHAPRSDDDEIGLGLNGDEGEGGDRRPLDDDALGEADAALDGDVARLLDDGVGLVLGQLDLVHSHVGDLRGVGDSGFIPGRDGIESRHEEQGGVAQARHLTGSVDDVGVLLKVADSGDDSGIGHGCHPFVWRPVRRRRSRW